MSNKVIILGLISLSLIFLTGCWDRIELEEQAYIVVVGLDKDGGDGTSVSVTYQISNPQGGLSTPTGGSEKEPPSEIITVKAPDIISAQDLMSSNISRSPSFSQTRTLVVSEELARTKKFLPLLEAAMRKSQIQRDIFFIVSKERASDFIRNNSPVLIQRPHKFYDYMAKQGEETGMLSKSTIHKFLQLTEGDDGIFLAIYGTTEPRVTKKDGNEDEYLAGQVPEQGGNTIQLIGSAAFKEGKLVGLITGEETRISQLLRENYKVDSMIATFPDPLSEKYRVTASVTKSAKTKIKMDLTKDEPVIDVTVPLTMDIVAIPSMIDYVENEENQRKLNNFISEVLTKKFERLIERTQEEFIGEPFAWSLIVRRNFKTSKEYFNYNWFEKYPKAKVSLSFDITFNNFGKQRRPPKLNEIRD